MFVRIYISFKTNVFKVPGSSDPGVAPAGAMAAHYFQMPKRGDWYITKAQPIPILYRILEKRFR